MTPRYAIYFTATGALGALGAEWLGWDIAGGVPAKHPIVGGLEVADITQTPRKYGFHGTIKAPFYLAQGQDLDALQTATAQHCAQAAPVPLEGLKVAALGRFLALVPVGDAQALSSLAATTVQALDRFRAPATEAELTRRRRANLTPAQDAHLIRWGYPHVMDQFRFHITLTGRLPRQDAAQIMPLVASHFAPALPAPFAIDALTLAVERPDGKWQTIRRIPLTG